jgi:hypothetical protein
VLLGPARRPPAHIIRPKDFRMAPSTGSCGRAARPPACSSGSTGLQHPRLGGVTGRSNPALSHRRESILAQPRAVGDTARQRKRLCIRGHPVWLTRGPNCAPDVPHAVPVREPSPGGSYGRSPGLRWPDFRRPGHGSACRTYRLPPRRIRSRHDNRRSGSTLERSRASIRCDVLCTVNWCTTRESSDDRYKTCNRTLSAT